MNTCYTGTITLLFLFLGYSSYAQSVHLKGRVTDRSSGNPLEFANIALLSPSDSAVVTGGMTDLDGSFDFQAEAGSYIFRVGDRKSTRLNSSHVRISYAVFCLKKKKEWAGRWPWRRAI